MIVIILIFHWQSFPSPFEMHFVFDISYKIHGEDYECYTNTLKIVNWHWKRSGERNLSAKCLHPSFSSSQFSSIYRVTSSSSSFIVTLRSFSNCLWMCETIYYAASDEVATFLNLIPRILWKWIFAGSGCILPSDRFHSPRRLHCGWMPSLAPDSF